MDKKVRVSTILKKKADGIKITALTAYDYTFGYLIDEAGVDLILVGDSCGNVCAGHETTLPVTVDEVIYHTRSVRRGVKRALLVADMPFMSYQETIEQALHNAGRFMKEGRAEAVKMEGG
ncbi:MAG: 3-methyl-2-oxobutanoate hydroxymethyltransferase, partial [Candidatus Marinimicrobia bacterium]|nr:3-methyl-2-oxobutanoate hydroxymethyltransferase [Candidatus Neomarinimicrobiota bacterium]